MSKGTVNGTGEDISEDEYVIAHDDGDLNALATVTDVTVMSGKKIQLEQFEPIEEQASLTADLSGLTDEGKAKVISELSRAARDVCETNVARTYEEHVRKEAFGE